MPVKTKCVYILALLLAVIFLAAQLHCCVELNSVSAGSHACPICAAAGSVIVTPSLVIIMVQSINRFEMAGEMSKIFVVVLRNIGPRAPPAC